ncbi:hypothetical protein AB0K60_13590 [Thermopolyspora sp. NPDC052614]|uniref:hypothetical protein n=1 Tax=Thermopolyspora sp. NPDC052614 TaxID=3155682 RepID=UPI00341A04DC
MRSGVRTRQGRERELDDPSRSASRCTKDDAELSRFLLSCADRLWTDCLRPDSLLAGNDWRRPPEGPVHLSTQLSAIMATEACALLAKTAVRE